MTLPKHATQIAALVRDATAGESEPGPSPEVRAAAVSALERALEARRRELRARRTRRAITLVSAAVILLGVGAAAVSRTRAGAGELASKGAPGADAPVVAVSRTGSGGEVFRADGSAAALPSDVLLGAGSRAETPAGGALHLAFATGTELELREGGAVEVAEAGRTQSFRLSRGSLSAHVAKLSEGHRFLVRTSDAEVEVRGTRFTVTVADAAACEGGTTTRVHVTEGLVVVRASGTSGTKSEVHVPAGASWPPCATAAQASSAPASIDRPPPDPRGSDTPHPKPATTAARSPAPSGASEPASSLAEQNSLYELALGHKRAGSNDQAVAAFERLLARFPGGPLAESASAERMRLLAKQGSPRARTAAREYLAAYPKGFASGDAAAIAGSSAP